MDARENVGLEGKFPYLVYALSTLNMEVLLTEMPIAIANRRKNRKHFTESTSSVTFNSKKLSFIAIPFDCWARETLIIETVN